MAEVLVKYHNARMFLTIDIQTLFSVLFEEFGEGIKVEIAPMLPTERSQSSTEVSPVTIVTERFWIFTCEAEGLKRHTELERRVVDEGDK